MNMSRLTNATNMIMKSKILIKNTPRSFTLEDDNICVYPTLIDNSFKLCFKSGYRKISNSVLEWLIFNLFLIIHTLMSEIHIFNFVNDSKSLTFKLNVELGIISVDVISNIMVSKYCTKWKQIQIQLH